MHRDDHQLSIWQLYKYLGSSWFGRGWVFQEVILSRQSKVIFKASTISLEGLYWISEAIKQVEEGDILSVGIENVTTSAHGLGTISMMRRIWQSLHRPGDSQSLPYQSFPDILSAIVSKTQTSFLKIEYMHSLVSIWTLASELSQTINISGMRFRLA